jgi:hypothetical protein
MPRDGSDSNVVPSENRERTYIGQMAEIYPSELAPAAGICREYLHYLDAHSTPKTIQDVLDSTRSYAISSDRNKSSLTPKTPKENRSSNRLQCRENGRRRLRAPYHSKLGSDIGPGYYNSCDINRYLLYRPTNEFHDFSTLIVLRFIAHNNDRREINFKRLQGTDWEKQSKTNDTVMAGRYSVQNKTPGPGEYFFGSSGTRSGSSAQVFSLLARGHEGTRKQDGVMSQNASNTVLGPGTYSVASAKDATSRRPKSAFIRTSGSRNAEFDAQGNVKAALGQTSESVGPGKYAGQMSQFDRLNNKGLEWSYIPRFKSSSSHISKYSETITTFQQKDFVESNIAKAIEYSPAQMTTNREACAIEKQRRTNLVQKRLASMLAKRERDVLQNLNRQEVQPTSSANT